MALKDYGYVPKDIETRNDGKIYDEYGWGTIESARIDIKYGYCTLVLDDPIKLKEETVQYYTQNIPVWPSPIFKTQEAVQIFLGRVSNIIKKFGYITISELRIEIGNPKFVSSDEFEYGWDSLDDISIECKHDCTIIWFPQPKLIKPKIVLNSNVDKLV